MSFFGYLRPDGSVGTRNYVLVIPQGIIAKSVCDFVSGYSGNSDRGSWVGPYGK